MMRPAMAIAALALAGGPALAAPAAPAPPTGAVDVRAFGARGDGKTDDTKAVQAAADALRDHGTLAFPAGEYLVRDVVLPSRRHMTVVGHGARLVGRPGVGPGFMLASWKFARDVSEADQPGLRIVGLHVDGRGHVADGLVVQSWASRVEGCTVGGCRNGIVFTAAAIGGRRFPASSMVNGRIVGNTVRGCPDAGILVRDPARNRCTDMFIQDNLVSRCGTGIKLEASAGTLVAGNHGYANDTDLDVGIGGVGCRISANYFESPAAITIRDMVGKTNLILVGNTLRGTLRAHAGAAGAALLMAGNDLDGGRPGAVVTSGLLQLRGAIAP